MVCERCMCERVIGSCNLTLCIIHFKCYKLFTQQLNSVMIISSTFSSFNHPECLNTFLFAQMCRHYPMNEEYRVWSLKFIIKSSCRKKSDWESKIRFCQWKCGIQSQISYIWHTPRDLYTLPVDTVCLGTPH